VEGMAKQRSGNRSKIILYSVLLIVVVGVFALGIIIGKGNPTTVIVFPTPTPKPKPFTSIYHIPLLDPTKGPPGVDTGVTLTFGEQLTIKATGQAKYAPNAPPTTPDGASVVNGAPAYDGAGFFANAPLGILVGCIVPIGTCGNGQWFVVGSSYSERVWVAGKLYLTINDNPCPGCYEDNTGGYQVTITTVQG
jgi:hypothetical protein